MSRATYLAVAMLLTTAIATAAKGQLCGGDCNDDRQITVDEIVLAVNIALGDGNVDDCMAADTDASSSITVDEILQAISNALEGCEDPAATPTATPSPPPTIAPTPTTNVDSNFIPTQSAALLPWLRDGAYLGWHAESVRHPSGGPHTSSVRTYVNDILYQSLLAENGVHPAGAAAVKELYGSSTRVSGWAVEVKEGEDSDGGEGWYWYERSGSSVFADGRGEAVCSSCHSRDFGTFMSKDLVLSPFPLQ